MFAKAIVRPPAPNFAKGLTTAGLGPPDYQRALKQHEAYCAALERCGLTLIRLDADPNYPDSCFVEDTAIVIPEFAFQCARVPTPTRAVLTQPGAASRTGEVESMRAALEQIAPVFAIQQIQPPGTLDGGIFVKRAKTISSAYRSEQTKRARSNWRSLSPRTVTRLALSIYGPARCSDNRPGI
jgi:dimethylargininase